MSRTQQKLQAMSAQELLIQEKKRMIEEKMHSDKGNTVKKAKVSDIDQPPPLSLSNNRSDQQAGASNVFKNDGSFLEQFYKAQGRSSSTSISIAPSVSQINPNTESRKPPLLPEPPFRHSEFPPHGPAQQHSQLGPPWFPPPPSSSARPPRTPPIFDHCLPPGFTPPNHQQQQQPPPFHLPPPPPLPFNRTQLPPPPFNPQQQFPSQSAFFPPSTAQLNPPPSSGSLPPPSSFIRSPFLAPPPSGLPLLPPPPTSFSLPPPDLLSKMLQTPPPPLPVAAPVNDSTANINSEDLYDPLQAEDDEEDDVEQNKSTVASNNQKPTRSFNIKKEYTIKIEPHAPATTHLSSLESEHQKLDIGGNRRRQVATTSSNDLSSSSSSALWWNNGDDEDTDDRKTNALNYSSDDTADYHSSDANRSKRKSRWNASSNANIKQEMDEHKFVQQIHEATEKAKNFVTQLNEQMKLYPEGYDGNKLLSGEQRDQFVEQKELQSIYQTMVTKRRELEKFARQQQFKREYDSDEETDDDQGTWEHRVRAAEMDITREWAVKLTDMANGKHHIGDFMPAHEMEKFMATYAALKEGLTPDVSDYQDFKIQAENIGYRLLEKLGWQEGKGLGKRSQGIVDPVNKGSVPVNHGGLGQDRPSELARNDDEFQMYRKRMMLAYRFRPNPLNNPRRDYY